MDRARAPVPSSELSFGEYTISPRSSGPSRRDSLGREVAPVIWRALDRATERTTKFLERASDGSQNPEAAAPMVIAAAGSVRRLTKRAEDGSTITAPTPLTHEVVEALRSEFVRQLQQEVAAIDGRQLLRVLLAFDSLERITTRTAGAPEVDLDASTPGVEGLVEIAHDMRSPLSSILFLVDAIRSGQSGFVSAVQERQLGLIYGAALGLSNLASDLMDLVRGSDRLVDGKPAPFSVAEVVHYVRDIVHPIAEEKALTLEVKLPLVDGRIGYAGALGRVLLNLTTNALKYTDCGSVRIGCSEPSPSHVVFWVADTGRGIPEHVSRVLFSPFRRTAGRMYFSNTGLGLAICRSLLSAMNSSLKVESNSSTGTRFSFDLELPPPRV